MSSIRWGSDREILLRIYQTLVQSKIDFGCIVYGSARRSYLNQLNKIQNLAVRHAICAFRTSPIEAILCDASSLPLNLRRDMQLITYGVKIQTLSNHLNNKIFTNLPSPHTLRRSSTKPSSIRFSDTSEEYRINLQTEKLTYTYDTPPWLRKLPQINISLSKYKKEDTAPSMYRTLFLEQMDLYNEHLVIYTDGSKSDNGTGAAIVIGVDSFFWILNQESSILNAELYAIWQALLYFSQSSFEKCLVCTDSLTATLSTKNRFSANEWVVCIQELLTHLYSMQRTISIMWIPGHTDIPGNTEADLVAKKATSGTIDKGIPNTFLDMKTDIKNKIYEAW